MTTQRKRGNYGSRGTAHRTDRRRSSRIAARKNVLVEQLVAQSPLPDGAAKTTLATTVAIQMVHLEELHAQEAAGTLSVEESRTMPSVASSISRMLGKLGVDKPIEKDLGVL